ncbi:MULTISPECIES: RNA chaperone Hfq [Acetobacter]|uniref:RNA-binding protein Hfq n=1 Tax=Acetobacter thailandicus TaxID=1502842 RepID=A0ABT3QB42_9PROT|nr:MULTISPECIES: RNA chaperone Hfq [Acetobacter]MBS0959313.1 RNA chaperone Hfq [Acetobacter thailandicus]MBS0980651.1 RNA chaperone Hfq [Acetobacter thailandicus]MBS0984794.1 RNA chaperone Hfq [Acetobacter thailandicus]MBS1003687.1 RNA chaperone Hfq [Acetobacter thailandicus]MCX2562504.1 RNA chaperone Hfq [Acetobacter thailandicus]
MEKETGCNVQDAFLSQIRRSRASVTIFLVNGVKLQGNITWFDETTVLLKRDDQTQLIYKHAISTVMPSVPVNVFETAEEPVSSDKEMFLRDDFL